MTMVGMAIVASSNVLEWRTMRLPHMVMGNSSYVSTGRRKMKKVPATMEDGAKETLPSALVHWISRATDVKSCEKTPPFSLRVTLSAPTPHVLTAGIVWAKAQNALVPTRSRDNFASKHSTPLPSRRDFFTASMLLV